MQSLVTEAVWVEMPEHNRLDLTQGRPFGGGAIQTNVIGLFRAADDRIAAFVSADPSSGGFAAGDSVHEAIGALADKLVSKGVWIEVSARRTGSSEKLRARVPKAQGDRGDTKR